MLLIFLLVPFIKQEGQLEVVPTKEPDVFNIIYKGDMKWNVEVTLYNDKGKKRMQHEVKDTDGFILPISLKNEESGTFIVEVFTPVYDLKKEFEYVRQVDLLATLLSIGFNKENTTITVSSEEPVNTPFDVFILNEDGDQLVMDDVEPLGGKVTRIYNLKGAPALKFQLIITSSGSQVLRQTFE